MHIIDAPPQLVEHCRASTRSEVAVSQRADFDREDVAGLFGFLTEQGEFETHDEWVRAGMAVKLAFGDGGLDLWRLTHDATVHDGVETSKWRSFASTPSANSVTLATWLQRAHQLGWTGNVRRSAQSMFAGVPSTASPSIVPTDGLETISAASFAGKTVPVRKWHVRGLLPAETVTMLGGDGAVGKSLLALQLAVATATHKLWLNRLVQPGPCLFLTAEDSVDEVHTRLNDVARGMGLSFEALSDLHIRSLAGEDAVLAAPDGRSNTVVATALFEALSRRVETLRPALVVLDTLADLFAGEENNRAQARQFIGLLRGIALRQGTTVLLLSHPSLSGMATGSGTSGSTAWNNSVRSRLYLDRIRGEGGIENDPNARVLKSMKSNYGRVGEEIVMHWRNGAFAVDQATAANLAAVGDTQNRADEIFMKLLMLYRAEERGAVSPNPGHNYAPKLFATHPEAQGLRTAALRAAMDRLLASKRIQTTTVGPPSRLRQCLIVSPNCDPKLTDGATNALPTLIPTSSNDLPTPIPTPPNSFQPVYQRPAIPTPIPPLPLRAPDGAPRA